MVFAMRNMETGMHFLRNGVCFHSSKQIGIQKGRIPTFSCGSFFSANPCVRSFNSSPILASRVSVQKKYQGFPRFPLAFFYNMPDPSSASYPVGTFHFPEKDVIVKYLTNHPSTRDRYFKENNIITAVATFFSNKRMHEDRAKLGVMVCLYQAYPELRLSDLSFRIAHLKLMKALEDCVKGIKL